MLIQDQFGVIKNLQTSPIPKTSFLPRTFLPFLTARLLQQADIIRTITQRIRIRNLCIVYFYISTYSFFLLVLGHVGWGIGWYINGLLIPEIYVVRGKTYTFVIEGGNDPDSPAGMIYTLYLCPKWSILVQTCPNLSRFAKTCQNMSIHVHT